jgi:hypothetical protein
MKGYAPGWQIRCKKCGSTRDAADAGMIRIGAASIGKHTLGWCGKCRRLRMLIVEPKPQSPPAATATAHA